MFQNTFFRALLVWICMLVPSAYAGKVELTTYYPAPHGEYDNLSANKLALNPNDDSMPADACTNGQMYYDDSEDSFYGCKNSVWEKLGASEYQWVTIPGGFVLHREDYTDTVTLVLPVPDGAKSTTIRSNWVSWPSGVDNSPTGICVSAGYTTAVGPCKATYVKANGDSVFSEGTFVSQGNNSFACHIGNRQFAAGADAQILCSR